MKKILVKKHIEDLEIPTKIEKGDWIDLRASEDIAIPFGEFALISLGISMKLPEGYEAHVVPRSSTFKNYGIIQTNSIGIIDNSYCGNDDIWRFPAYNIGKKEGSVIRKNERICQFRIVEKQPTIDFEEVEFLDAPNRGGFGSTGIK